MISRALDALKLLFTILAGAISVVVFSYSTFASKEYVKEVLVDRLDRIEAKLDRLIEGRRHDQRALPRLKKTEPKKEERRGSGSPGRSRS